MENKKIVKCGICNNFETTDSNEMIKHFIENHPKNVDIKILDKVRKSKELQNKLKITIPLESLKGEQKDKK